MRQQEIESETNALANLVSQTNQAVLDAVERVAVALAGASEELAAAVSAALPAETATELLSAVGGCIETVTQRQAWRERLAELAAMEPDPEPADGTGEGIVEDADGVL